MRHIKTKDLPQGFKESKYESDPSMITGFYGEIFVKDKFFKFLVNDPLSRPEEDCCSFLDQLNSADVANFKSYDQVVGSFLLNKHAIMRMIAHTHTSDTIENLAKPSDISLLIRKVTFSKKQIYELEVVEEKRFNTEGMFR